MFERPRSDDFFSFGLQDALSKFRLQERGYNHFKNEVGAVLDWLHDQVGVKWLPREDLQRALSAGLLNGASSYNGNTVGIQQVTCGYTIVCDTECISMYFILLQTRVVTCIKSSCIGAKTLKPSNQWKIP